MPSVDDRSGSESTTSTASRTQPASAALAADTAAVAAPPIAADDPQRFVPPEVSWLKLNRRYLAEAQNADRPLLERAKLLGSFSSHLDEFLMEFLPQLRLREAESGADAPLHPASALHEVIRADLDTAAHEWETALRPALAAAGIAVVSCETLSADQTLRLDAYFEHEILPLCTPLAYDPAHPFPFIADRTRNFIVVFDGDSAERYGFLNLPSSLPRLVPVPEKSAVDAKDGATNTQPQTFVWIDDLLAGRMDSFFPGEDITGAYVFRVLRQTLITTEEAAQGDLLEAVRRDLEANRFAPVAALQVGAAMPETARRILTDNLQASDEVTFVVESLSSIRSIGDLAHLPRPDLKYAPLVPRPPEKVVGRKNFFKAIAKRDILLNHPYDSFDTVVRFLRRAASDPEVVAIRQTLYHVGRKSPIASALIRAAQAGKQVTAVMEIRAHFDEENNIEWALAMKRAGVNVVYGAADTKTHAKTMLVVRREPNGVRQYAHIATGNYDVSTAEHECDLGMLTSDPTITRDVLDLVNHLTGRSRQPAFRRLLVAPINLREELLKRIDREIALSRSGESGHLIFQMSGLTDTRLIDALYRASASGVQVDLVVRSVCSLRPRLPGLSDRVRVVNFMGRFKEHSRIYYFRNGGRDEVYFGSADLMPAKVDNRVEMLLPVEDPAYRRYIVQTVLGGYLRDNVSATELDGNGDCLPRPAPAAASRFDIQEALIEEAGKNLEHRLPRRSKGI